MGSIHKRIIQNLYEDPIIVCDVSGKNPNVMFELGMRLAFDKPTIIIKDDVTSYSFDTSSIEHIDYPRDLRFSKINEFKERLCGKIKSTYDSAKSNKDYTTFLKHFGDFKVAKIEKTEVSSDIYMLEELKSLRQEMRFISREFERNRVGVRVSSVGPIRDFCMKRMPEDKVDEFMSMLSSSFRFVELKKREESPGHFHIEARFKREMDSAEARNMHRKFVGIKNGIDEE